MSETNWTYALAAVLNATYFDPVTRRLYKALVAGVGGGAVTFTSATDVVNWTAHGRANGDVFAYALSGGTSPAGLSPLTPYYIINAATDTFQISLTPDGLPINFTSDGTANLIGHINAPFDDASAWQDRGPPDRFKMFDQSNQTATPFTTSCQVVVAPGSRIDTIAAMAMDNVSHIYIAATGTDSSRTNLALRSQTFDNATWTKTNGSITADAIRAPDGSLTADKFNGDATNGVHTISQSISGTGNRTASVYVQAAQYTKGYIAITGSAVCGFDLETGTITLESGTATYGIERVNNSGWYRVWIMAFASSTGMTIGLRASDGSDSHSGNATQGFYLWGAQYETSAEPTSYIATTTASDTSTTHSHYEVYDLTDTAFSNDWYASIYSETVYRRDVATSTIPPLPSQSITVTLISPGAGSIGNLVFALSKDIGKAEYSSRAGTRDFSVKETDEFGNVAYLTERGFAKRGNFTVALKERRSDAIKGLIDDNRAIPNLWLMAPDRVEETGLQWKERGIFYGPPRTWDFQFWQPEDDKFELELEGFV